MSSEAYCSFCGKHNDFVKVMIAAPQTPKGQAFICNDCVDESKKLSDWKISQKKVLE